MALKVVKDAIRFWHVFDSWASYTVSWATSLPWILVGLVVALPRWRDFMLIHLLLGSAILNGMIFHAAVRFRLPFEPFLLVFAAIGFSWLWWRSRSRWLLAVTLTALLLVNVTLRANQDDLRSRIRRTAEGAGFEVSPWTGP